MRRYLIIGLAMGLIAGLAVLNISRPAADSKEAALRTLVPKITASWESLDISKIEANDAADIYLIYCVILPMKYDIEAEYTRIVIQPQRRQ